MFGLLYSKEGGTGKTQFISAYMKISGGNIMQVNAGKLLDSSDKFNVSGTSDATGLVANELPAFLNNNAADTIKELADPSALTRVVEDKGKNVTNVDNMLGILMTTNRVSDWGTHDDAMFTRFACVRVESDKSNIALTEDEYRQQILFNQRALEYLLSISIEAYMEARKSFRAEGFRFGLDDSEWYWKKISTENSLVDDFINSDVLTAIYSLMPLTN